jgi:hypothetical protein
MTAALTSAHRTKRQQSFMCSDQTSKGQTKPAFLSHESNEGRHRNTQSCGITDPKGARDRRGNHKLTGDDVAEARHHRLSRNSQVTTDRTTDKWERPESNSTLKHQEYSTQ